jgi:DNA-binding MarR family transcriptional regulator
MTTTASICPSGDDRVKLFGLLLETNARLSRNLGLALEATCDMPLAWFEVLLLLRQSPQGYLKMNQIAEAIVHTTGGTTRLIDRLEEAQYVTRRQCPSDRRAINVAISPLGNEKLDEALDVHLTYLEENLAARLSEAERTTLTDLLSKLGSTKIS